MIDLNTVNCNVIKQLMKGCIAVWLMLVTAVVAGQPALNKNYSTGDGNTGLSVLQVVDGYLVCGGGYALEDSGWFATKILKVDTLGNLLWIKSVGKPSFAYYPGREGSFLALSDGNYICGGTIIDSSGQLRNPTVYKFDTNGDTVWIKQNQGISYGMFNQTIETTKKDLVSVGWKALYYGGVENIFLQKMDSLGNQIWIKTYGRSGRADAYSVEQTIDGGYVIGGSVGDSMQFMIQPYAAKVDSNGLLQWENIYANQDYNSPAKIKQSHFGGYYIWGSIVTQAHPEQLYVYRLDSGGAVIWRHYFNNYSNPYLGQLIELTDGSLVMVGGKDVPSTNLGGGWVTKLDSSGNELWERIFPCISLNGRQRVSSFNDLKITSDNGFIITGLWIADSTGTYKQNFWLVKTDSLGCVGSDCGYKDTTSIAIIPTPEQPTLSIYPNPTYSTAIVSWQTDVPLQDAIISLFDVLGREVHQAKVQGINQAQVSLSGLQQGLYIVKVTTGGSVMTGRVMVE